MHEGVRDGASRDPWSAVGGRPEAPALARRRTDGRTGPFERGPFERGPFERGAVGPVPLLPAQRPRRRQAHLTTTALAALLTLVCLAVWMGEAPGEPLGRPATAPAGEGGYAFLDERPDGRPVTFDPCRPIHYVVRPDGQPPSGAAMLAAAIAEVSRTTGLVFVDDGTTGDAPSTERHLAGRWSLRSATTPPVLIAWATEDEWPSLAGTVVGEAGPVSQVFARSSERFVTGQVVLDAEDLAHAPDDVVAAQQVRLVALHELGHLVGLGHVDDPTQLMHAETGGALTGFGAGDLRGLHLLGSGDCG